MRNYYKVLLVLIASIFIFHGSSFGQNEYFLDFDGSTDYIYYADDATLGLMDGATDYTIEAWIYPVDGRVVEYDRVLTRYFSFKITMWDGGNNGDVEDWYFSVSDGSGAYTHYNTEGDATLTLDAWNHIAIINNSTDEYLKLFVNGVDVTTSGGYSNQSLRASVASDNLYIGSSKASTPNNSFGGYIDELRLKNTAVAVGDLSSNKNDNQYITDANTAALFHFDEGTGGNTLNESSSSNASLNNVIAWRSWDYAASHHLPLAHEWTGSTDSDWATAGNWDGGVPSTTNDVLIPNVTNDPLIGTSTDADCNNMTIENSAVLSIGGSLNVDGTLTNDADVTGLILKSTASEQGSLINSTTNVAATVERQITQYTGDNDGWHLLSSPVNNMAIASSDFEPVANTDDLFYWDESQGAAGMWINYHVEGGGFGFTHFTNGQGFLCAYAADDTKEFQGNLNVTDVTRGSFSNVNPDPWELVGNPFSSAIDWTAGTWTKTGLGSNAKVYNEGAGNYQTKTIIPSTQGFIVEVTNGTNSLTIPADARVHDAQDWYKNQKTAENTLELKLSGSENSFYDITQIILTEGATMEFDNQFDGHKFYGVPSAPQMYTTSPSMEKLTDNHIPNTEDEVLIPLNIEVGSDGNYQIDVELNSLQTGSIIFLEDLLTGHLINLSSQETYAFQASIDDESNRFILHFNNTTGIEETTNSNTIRIYSNEDRIYLQSEDIIAGQVNIYDLGGKLIQSNTINGSRLNTITVNGVSGIYFVELISNNKTYNQKIIIQ